MAQRTGRFGLLVLLIALIVIGAPIAYYFYDPNPIRYENFELITAEMSEAEVEKLLGCPPADYRRGHVEYEEVIPEYPPFETEQHWMGDRGDIRIFRDAEGRITGKLRLHGEREPAYASWGHAFWEFVRRR